MRVDRAALASMALLTLLLLYSCSMPQGVKTSDCIVVTAEQGEIFTPLIASGTVEAENEVLVRSPYPSVIKQIIKEPGSRVQAGEPILLLDETAIREEIDKLKDQLDIKHNAQEKNKLNETSTTVDLNYSEEVKKLNITSLKTQLADEEQLLEVGGISPAKIEKTKQEIALAEKELLMTKQKNAIRLKQLNADERGLELDIKVQEKVLADKLTILNQMRVVAPSNGIILSIANKVGEKVNGDVVLVRMSDLSTFKVSGSVEDKAADFVKTGRKVFAMIEGERLLGTIGTVAPVIENNKIQFTVHLEQNNNPKLIPNQRIPLWIVKDELKSGVMINNLKLFENDPPKVVYVLKEKTATRRSITTGMQNPDHIQVLSGLEAGERIVIPKKGMSVFRNAESVVITD